MYARIFPLFLLSCECFSLRCCVEIHLHLNIKRLGSVAPGHTSRPVGQGVCTTNVNVDNCTTCQVFVEVAAVLVYTV